MTRSILLVEDSPTQAQRTQMILSREGYEVSLAENGREGLDKVMDCHPDMVITDIEMPVMDGYRLCKFLKTDNETAKIPVVMLTSCDESLDIIRGLEVGADNFITKPFEEYDLLSRVAKVFDNLEQRQKGELKEDKLISGYQGQIAITSDRKQILELLYETMNKTVKCDLMGLLLISNTDSHLFFQVSDQPVTTEASYDFKRKILSGAILLSKHESTVRLVTNYVVKKENMSELIGDNRSFASVPLITGSQTIGMLAISNMAADIFDTDDIKFLFQLGTEAARAFDRIMR